MKTLLVVICALAGAQAQFGNRGNTVYRADASASSNNAFTSRGNNVYRGEPPSNNAFTSRSNSVYTGEPVTTRQTYVSNVQTPTAAPQKVVGGCGPDSRQPVPGSCDKYVECINGTAEEKLCPDGLRYNPNTKITSYPCGYPNEVQCLERSALQPAQPTELCPNQFGYYKLGDAKNCSSFRNCVNGAAYDFTCPEGLAFNIETYRCEWPDEVADCDAEAFLGFRCPAVPESRELGAPAGFRFYRADTNCQKYFMCIDGRPRALYCGGFSAFDELTSTCVHADDVDSCPVELREQARRYREEEQQRLAKQLEFEAKNLAKPKRRFN